VADRAARPSAGHAATSPTEQGWDEDDGRQQDQQHDNDHGHEHVGAWLRRLMPSAHSALSPRRALNHALIHTPAAGTGPRSADAGRSHLGAVNRSACPENVGTLPSVTTTPATLDAERVEDLAVRRASSGRPAASARAAEPMFVLVKPIPDDKKILAPDQVPGPNLLVGYRG
jgi:hypothetical protein